MGAMHATRLSFMPTLIRRMRREEWRFEKLRLELDDSGYGRTVLAAHAPERSYALVAFTHPLDPGRRTDRVIAEAWDATFSLFDGLPGAADLERLAANTPRQEAGRFTASELVLSRANKSVRLFEHVVERLAAGAQPEVDQVARVGYLMRTTAVYGNGKFGCADRACIETRAETRGAFQVEMLAVYLIRWFTIELVEHLARRRGGAAAVALDPALRRFIGIGNATGLGMAPFLIRHPILVHRWVVARETALARVLARPARTPDARERLAPLLKRVARHLREWNVDDPLQQRRIVALRAEIDALDGVVEDLTNRRAPSRGPWRAIHEAASGFSMEGQELAASLLIEANGELVDDLAENLCDPEPVVYDPTMKASALRESIERNYAWTRAFDFSKPAARQRFWYYSRDKIEPRLGDRYEEPGVEVEMPLGVAWRVARLERDLRGLSADLTVAEVCRRRPGHRYVIRRIQTLDGYPYAEIRDNLTDRSTRPIDLLRFKLAFFGASKFDPKSDLWTRITLYQGAPTPHELQDRDLEDWTFPASPAPA